MRTIHSNTATTISILILALSLLASCASKSSANSSDSLDSAAIEIEEDTKSNALSISIGIPYPAARPGDDYLKYAVKENGDTIYIYPDSGYFKDFSSDKEMEFYGERDVYCSDFIENPHMECYITNNTEETLSFSKMRINVHSSALDAFPLIYIQQCYYHRYGMEMLNECWKDWGTMTIEYSFEKKGKPWNGKYDHVLKVPYFKDNVIIDFRADIIKEGFDHERVQQYIDPAYRDANYNQGFRVVGHSAKPSDINFAPLGIEDEVTPALLSKLAYPFEYEEMWDGMYYIFTRIHARLSFSKHGFKKKITGIIPLTCIDSGGAENDMADEFDIMLKPEGKDYHIDLPYIATLRPGKTEKIKVGIKCEKSSHHNMDIQLISDNGEIFDSKPIRFYNVNGRHSSYHVLKVD